MNALISQVDSPLPVEAPVSVSGRGIASGTSDSSSPSPDFRSTLEQTESRQDSVSEVVADRHAESSNSDRMTKADVEPPDQTTVTASTAETSREKMTDHTFDDGVFADFDSIPHEELSTNTESVIPASTASVAEIPQPDTGGTETTAVASDAVQAGTAAVSSTGVASADPAATPATAVDTAAADGTATDTVDTAAVDTAAVDTAAVDTAAADAGVAVTGQTVPAALSDEVQAGSGQGQNRNTEKSDASGTRSNSSVKDTLTGSPEPAAAADSSDSYHVASADSEHSLQTDILSRNTTQTGFENVSAVSRPGPEEQIQRIVTPSHSEPSFSVSQPTVDASQAAVPAGIAGELRSGAGTGQAAVVSQAVPELSDSGVRASLPVALALRSRLQNIGGIDPGRVQVRLDPPELGSVFVEVSSTDDGIVARLAAVDPVARAALRNELMDLKKTLSDAGYDNVDIDLSHDESAFERHNPNSDDSATSDHVESGSDSTADSVDGPAQNSTAGTALRSGKINILA